MHFITTENLNLLISGCIFNKREYQQKLYNSFFGFGMSICARYAKSKEDSIEILNQGFLKIFTELNQYVPYCEDEVASFKCWITNILVFTAIDHNRSIINIISLMNWKQQISPVIVLRLTYSWLDPEFNVAYLGYLVFSTS